MRKLVTVLSLVFWLASAALAQKPEIGRPVPPPPVQSQQIPAPCPVFSLERPSQSTRAGETIRYSVRMDANGMSMPLEYRWTLNPSTIFAGQGGSIIEFERPASQSLYVGLEIVGIPAHCPRNANETMHWDPTPQSIRLDTFPGPLTKITDQRWNRIASTHRSRPDSILFVVLEYKDDAGEAEAKQKGALVASLVKASSLDTNRISYVLGKTRYDRVQIFLIPLGAELPKLEK